MEQHWVGQQNQQEGWTTSLLRGNSQGFASEPPAQGAACPGTHHCYPTSLPLDPGFLGHHPPE